ncbi:fungal hydrophobin [Trichoderma harzianum]|uniref:Fungal hydrophobin n=1 Tax=Trichoderma harzianum TaxID=5544 RepID=A0A0F9ZKY4_TRIHA|nr:fungal hydrophobin [Trichoderma harzianum]
MKFSAIALFASLAIAAPATDATDATQFNIYDGPCSAGVTNNIPKCCGSGILDLLYLDCETPQEVTSPLNPLHAVCARVGLSAKCCTLGIADLGVLCQDALPQ